MCSSHLLDPLYVIIMLQGRPGWFRGPAALPGTHTHTQTLPPLMIIAEPVVEQSVMYEGSYQPRARQHSLYMCLSMALESADMADIQLLLMCHRLWSSGPITAAPSSLPVWPHFPKKKKTAVERLAFGRRSSVSARNNTGWEPQDHWQTDGPGDKTPSGSKHQCAVRNRSSLLLFPKHIFWQIRHLCVGAVTRNLSVALYRVRGGSEQDFQSWSLTERQ